MKQGKPDPLLVKPARKFLFDVHDFDDPNKEDEPEEELPPPPPVFTEEELDRARRESFQKGHHEAQVESDNSRARRIADLLDVISREFSTLFAAEDLRNAQYEAEAVRLSLAVFQRLFPAMNSKYGFEEIKKIITEVLESQREQSVIKLEIHPDYVEPIQEHVKRVIKQGHMAGECQILANHTLGPADCRLSWENGGALRDAGSVAEDIESHMQHILADRPRLRDNRRSEIKAPNPAEAPAPAPVTSPEGEHDE